MLDEIHFLIEDLVKDFSFVVNDYAGGVKACWLVSVLHSDSILVTKSGKLNKIMIWSV